MNFYLSLCFKTWVSSHRIQTTMQNTMLTFSNTMQNLSKLDCKTPLIHLYLISSLPVKGLPFKITFTTHKEQHCHGGMAADKFFFEGQMLTYSWWILKSNTFSFHVRKGSSSRVFSLLRGFWNCIVFWGNVEAIEELVLLFFTDREISHSSSYSYFAPCVAK